MRYAIFRKNDLVLIYKPIRKKGRSEKLLHRWMGPYIVIRQTTPVNYEVKLQVGKQKSDIAHVGSMKPYTQKNLSTEEIIPEANESTTQCENRPATSSETMGELQNQLKPTTMENENIETIATPIAEPSTATEKTNHIHLSDQQQLTEGHSYVSQQSREYNDTTPPYLSSPRPPSLPCTTQLHVSVIHNRTINIRSITTGHRNLPRTTGNGNE